MPIDYELMQNGTFVLARGTGQLSLKCFISVFKKLKGDMDLRFPYNSLLDLRHVTEIEIGEKDLVKIFRELTSGSRPHGSEKLAIVAENQKAFDLGYKYGETIKGMNKKVVVFFNVDVARKWLGLD